MARVCPVGPFKNRFELMLRPNRVARFLPSLESESKLHQGEGEKRRG